MGGHHQNFTADIRHFTRGGFQILRLAAGDGHFRAGFGKTVSDPLADAAAAAGNNRHFTF